MARWTTARGGMPQCSMANIMKLAKDKLRKMTMCGSELNTLGKLQENDNSLKIGPFVLQKKAMSRKAKYSFQAETTTSNIGKILRGLQIAKPILLEGSPGIGKTSLVEALHVSSLILHLK